MPSPACWGGGLGQIPWVLHSSLVPPKFHATHGYCTAHLCPPNSMPLMGIAQLTCAPQIPCHSWVLHSSPVSPKFHATHGYCTAHLCPPNSMPLMGIAQLTCAPQLPCHSWVLHSSPVPPRFHATHGYCTFGSPNPSCCCFLCGKVETDISRNAKPSVMWF